MPETIPPRPPHVSRGAVVLEALRTRPVTAALVALLAVAALAAGIGSYVAGSPLGSTASVVLGGEDQVLPAGLRTSVAWDFALVAGYGTALLLASLLARAAFWTPEARRLARALTLLSATTVVADLVENALLLLVLDGRSGLLDVVTATAVLKFSAGLPAAVIASIAVLVTAARLASHARRQGPRTRLEVVDGHPLGDEREEQLQAATGRADAQADRWRRGYLVPDLTHEQVDERARERSALGICLSGGGVRSATVALGALQRLSKLLEARYLVSVSGGGYTAGALQLALTEAGGQERPDGARVLRDARAALMPGSVEEDRIRRHASYLAGSPVEMLLALGVIARGLLLSLFVLFGPALVLGVALGRLLGEVPLAPWDPSTLEPWTDDLANPGVRTGAVLCIGALSVAAVLAYLTTLAVDATDRPSEGVRRVASGLTGLALLVAVLAAGLPALVYGASSVLTTSTTGPTVAVGSLGSVVLAYVAALAALNGQGRSGERLRSLISLGRKAPVSRAPRGAVRLLLVIASLVVLAAAWLLLLGGAAALAHRRDALVTAVAVGALLAALGGLLDQTSLSLHPFYRRRLAKAFAARRVLRKGHVIADGYPFAERTTLSEYGARPPAQDGRRLPEVVFSAAANLTGEHRAATDCVGFTMTGEWVGGPDVGYVRTAELEQAVSSRLSRDLTVQAAVAVSGAAVSSSMGRAGRLYQTLLAVSGVRLGTWLPNPSFLARTNLVDSRDWTAPGLPSLRRMTYLFREVLGIHRCSDRLLQITDGGHYDNLGLVELLRRRCTEIYCIDASGDAPPTAGALEQALTLAEAELGVRVVFDLPDAPWRLVPGSGEALAPEAVLASVNDRLAKEAVVTASIVYPEESGLDPRLREGRLVFAKALLTRDLSYDLLSYAARHPAFPRDSTGDQFFDDGQFSAYLALGRDLGARADAALSLRLPPQGAPHQQPVSVRP